MTLMNHKTQKLKKKKEKEKTNMLVFLVQITVFLNALQDMVVVSLLTSEFI